MSDIIIGENCDIHETVCFSKPFNFGDFEGTGKIIIEDDVFIYPYTVIEYPTTEDTIIRKGCRIGSQCYVGHDTVIERNTTMYPSSKIAGHCHIGKWCGVGLNSSLHQFSFLPNYCFIGANAFYKKNVKVRGLKMCGVPCKVIGINRVGIERSDISEEEKEALYEETNSIKFSSVI